MTADLTISVGGSADEPVVSVSGLLDASSAVDLRARFLEVLAEVPRSVTIDVSGLVTGDRISLTAFIAISHHAAAWPGCPLAMCGASPAIRADLNGMGVSRFYAMGRDHADAQRRLQASKPMRRIRERLQPTIHCVEAARDRARDVCMEWSVPALTEPAQSVVTELVTNSAQHAGTGIDMAFGLSRRFLYITVGDGSREPPAFRHDEDDEGYGLRLVDAFAAHWGHSLTTDGKVVWAALRRPSHGGSQKAEATRW
jgi:anti-anti-sigma regulatory factor